MPQLDVTKNKTEKAPLKGAIRRQNMAKIKSAAEKVFAEQGFQGASVGKIAELAEVPKPNVYYYFGSKEELYRSVVEEICTEWLEAGDRFTAEGDPRDAVCHYVQLKMDLARSRPQASRLWVTEMVRGAPVVDGYVRTTVKSWITDKEAVLKAWIDQGKIRAVDAQAYFQMIWATTQYYADYDPQVRIINNDKALTKAQFAKATKGVQDLALAALGVADDMAARNEAD